MGMQFDRAPASLGPRTTRYFSMPGFNSGPAGAAPRPAPGPPPCAGAPRPPPAPKLYTPDRSGLPLASRGTSFLGSILASAPPAVLVFTGAVPGTVTVTSRVSTVLLGPRTVSV